MDAAGSRPASKYHALRATDDPGDDAHFRPGLGTLGSACVILSTKEQAEVPAGHFRDALLAKDTVTIAPDVLKYKLYAPGVGRVLVLGVSDGGGREELVAIETVGKKVARAAGTTALGESFR